MASVATLPRPVVRVALHGACGRMGRMVIAALAASKTARLVAAIDRAAAPEIGRDAGEVAGVGALGTLVSPVLTPATAVDVCVDFSAPAALPGLVAQLLPRKVPAVICTTGVGADGARLIDDLSRVAGVIHTANTSLGVNVLLQV
ncbi:MAG: 4-hydroxy-tetrahydrodipicolinate reductase, partial [Planctomycetes bacterium]|nr:4-hydroxy-tetrahydrodipicolinate reductase [Planctomycetota bacterium]